MQLWRPRSPMICQLQAGKPGKQWRNSFQVQSPKTRSTDVQGQEAMAVTAQRRSKFALPLPFCSTHALSGLDDARPRW